MTPSTSAAAWLAARRIGRVRVLGNAGHRGASRRGRDRGDRAVRRRRTESRRSIPAGTASSPSPISRQRCTTSGPEHGRVTASHVPFFATSGRQGDRHQLAINSVIRALTGKRPKVLGKPSRDGFFAALAGMGLARSAAPDIVVVGDDPALEMRMANQVGRGVGRGGDRAQLARHLTSAASAGPAAAGARLGRGDPRVGAIRVPAPWPTRPQRLLFTLGWTSTSGCPFSLMPTSTSGRSTSTSRP